ncbi:MAG: bifunctional riboflavin kinase/FAD synthetase [Acidobacteriaceae bacterium]
MKIFRQLADVPHDLGPTVATIGNFDGVHCGHRAVLAEVIQRAKSLRAKSVAVTFDPHPAMVLRKGAGPELITPLEEKLSLLAACGLDAVLVLPFTQAMSQLSAKQFATGVLRDTLHAVEVHEGENFRFGKGAETGVAGLASIGRELGFQVAVYSPRTMRGSSVSSSRIRAMIAAGDVSNARALLGRSFAINGHPAKGRGLGSLHTVPTINLGPYAGLLPANGVYIACLSIDGEVFQAVTNIGNRPTFGEDSFAVESHLLNFHPVALTEQTQLRLTFLKRLRAEQKWPSTQALLAQIQKDVAQAQRYFHLLKVRSPQPL